MTSLIGLFLSLWPVFIQYDAAQLYLIVWNLIKDQIPDGDLVRPELENSEGQGAAHIICQP